MFVHVFASVTGWNHFLDAPWGYTEYRILGAMDSCPSGPGGVGGVENVTIWHTKGWNHRFYRGRSSQRLALTGDTNHIQRQFFLAGWEGRTVWNNEWTNHFDFVFLLLCEILPMQLPFGCFFLTHQVAWACGVSFAICHISTSFCTIYGLSKWTTDAAWVNSDKVLEYLNHPQNSFQ